MLNLNERTMAGYGNRTGEFLKARIDVLSTALIGPVIILVLSVLYSRLMCIDVRLKESMVGLRPRQGNLFRG